MYTNNMNVNLKLKRLWDSNFSRVVLILIVIAVSVPVTMFMKNNHKKSQNSNTAVSNENATKSTSPTNTAPKNKNNQSENEIKSTNASTQTSPNYQKNNTEGAATDPCPGLEKAVSESEYLYLSTANKYISIINKDIYDRYDSQTNTYTDLSTVQAAISYANYALDTIYDQIIVNYNGQKARGCKYNVIVKKFNLPQASDYPSNWGFEANGMLP